MSEIDLIDSFVRLLDIESSNLVATSRPHIFTLGIVEANYFIKTKKSRIFFNTINREIFVNTLLRTNNLLYNFSPTLIYSSKSRFIVFEYAKHNRYIDLNNDSSKCLLKKYMYFQKSSINLSLIEKFRLNISSSGLFLSSTRLLIKNKRIYKHIFFSILKQLIYLQFTHFNKNCGLIHKDLTLKKNYCYDGLTLRLNDLEQVIYERKWVLYDIIVISFDYYDLSVNIDFIKQYIQLAKLNISEKEVLIHIKFSLLRYCIGASNSIPKLVDFVGNILLKEEKFHDWILK